MSARDLQRSIESIVGVRPGYKPLDPPPPVGARAGAVATGRPAGGAGTQGVLFEEADFLQREYWAAQTFASSDGLFTLQVEPIRSILLTGGQRMRFSEPVEPPAP